MLGRALEAAAEQAGQSAGQGFNVFSVHAKYGLVPDSLLWVQWLSVIGVQSRTSPPSFEWLPKPMQNSTYLVRQLGCVAGHCPQRNSPKLAVPVSISTNRPLWAIREHRDGDDNNGVVVRDGGHISRASSGESLTSGFRREVALLADAP